MKTLVGIVLILCGLSFASHADPRTVGPGDCPECRQNAAGGKYRDCAS